MTVTLGVDNGLSGGLCWLSGLEDASFKSVIPMPVRQVGKSSRPDVFAIRDWLNDLIREHGFPSLVVLEKSQTMREVGGRKGATGEERKQQGSVQAHTQGFNAGILAGFFESLRLSIEEPSPQTWKAAVLKGFGEKDKAAMIAVVRQRFPSLNLLASDRSKKPHDGMADAVGLALFGQYRLGKIPT